MFLLGFCLCQLMHEVSAEEAASPTTECVFNSLSYGFGVAVHLWTTIAFTQIKQPLSALVHKGHSAAVHLLHCS